MNSYEGYCYYVTDIAGLAENEISLQLLNIPEIFKVKANVVQISKTKQGFQSDVNFKVRFRFISELSLNELKNILSKSLDGLESIEKIQ